ncbi:MAG: hypothetical protein Q7R35_10860 [Elusimicrobiota bacterium]|nr:hypothetical protein [Elusimicrobiota bacterium]
MKAKNFADHHGSPGGVFKPGGGHSAARTALLAVYSFAALILCSPVSRAQESGIVARDANGAFYSVSSRYNNRNEYLHISKMGRDGNMLWEANYDTGTDKKPVGMVAHSGGLVILASARAGSERSFSLIYYSFDNFLLREVISDTPGAVPVALAADKQDNIYIALTIKRANRARAELWKYDRTGAFFWSAVYEPLNNAYAQDVQTLYNGEVTFGVTQSGGSNTYGEYAPLALIYNANGARLR